MRLDALITNARVLTMDSSRPHARQIGIWNGKIVGVDEEVAAFSAKRVIDAGGKTVIPGFHDAHNHMATFGRSLMNIHAGQFASLDELYRAVRERATAHPEQEWIFVDAYDQHQLGGHPTRLGLDAAAPGRKIIANHRTTHLLVANTRVFEQVGALDPEWPVPAGGFVERDATGAPVGLIGEQAMAPFRDLTRPHSVALLTEAIARASTHFLAEGITSVGEAGIGDSAVVGSSPIEAVPYQLARESGQLGVRVQLMVSMENLHPVVGAATDGIDLGLDLGIRTGLGDDRLGIGALKMFTDGALASRTAALSAPFCDHDSSGIMQFDLDELSSLANAAARAGWQLAVHAIGDHAIDIALDVIAGARASAPHNRMRHRIEHASIVRDDQVHRFAAEDVIASVQPQFVSAIGDTVMAAVGDRAEWVYRHRSLLDAGVTVVGGSDRPVVSGNPLQAVQDSMYRVTSSGRDFCRHEEVDLNTALRGYTLDPAYATHREDRLGMIRTGYYADLAVLDGDLSTTPVDRIAATQVAATAVAGEFLFDPSGEFTA